MLGLPSLTAPDWEDVSFREQDYGKGYREPNVYSARSSRVHQDDDLDF